MHTRGSPSSLPPSLPPFSTFSFFTSFSMFFNVSILWE